MANGKPGRKCVDRGVRPDGEPYASTPKARKWQQDFAVKNPEKRLQYERQWRQNQSEEERLARKLAKRLYMRNWMREKRQVEILLELEQRRRKIGG